MLTYFYGTGAIRAIVYHQYLLSFRQQRVEADINIDDYVVESRELPVSSIQQKLNVVGKEYTITTIHKVEGGKTYMLNMRDESNGTINLFFFAPIIKRAFETGVSAHSIRNLDIAKVVYPIRNVNDVSLQSIGRLKAKIIGIHLLQLLITGQLEGNG